MGTSGHAALSPQLLVAPLNAPPPSWLAQPGRSARFSGLAAPLPPQLALMTLQSLGEASASPPRSAQLLLRLQHVGEAGDGGK